MNAGSLMRCLRFVILAGLALVLLTTGCEFDYGSIYGTSGGPTTSSGDGGSGGDLFTTGEGGDDGEPVCANACVAGAPAWFDGLSMFWIGPPDEAPPCPADIAPLEGSIGVADLHVAPHTCPACSCSPATCALPELMHASAAKCANADGAASIAWDAPPGWEGTCSAEEAIPGGLVCGGAPCVQSITISAPPVEPCAPLAQGAPVIAAPTWSTIARECMIGPLSGGGCATGEACAPAPPEGFALCVYRYGDHPTLECPAAYPRRLDIFQGVQDDRSCEQCACGEPQGAQCAALVSAFTGARCGGAAGSVVVTADEAACFDVPSGSVLGSKSAAFMVDKPGNCAPSGGAAEGAITLTEPVALCCTPEPESAD